MLRPPSADARPRARRRCGAAAIRRTRPPRAGSDTRTTRSAGCAARRVAEGLTHFKIKVGRDLADDIRRVRDRPRGDRRRSDADDGRQPGLGRGPGDRVDAALCAGSSPWWIEEPTSPDDVLGHAPIARALEPLGIGVATGEHCQNRVVFKQFLQAKAHQLLPDRLLPTRRGERGAGGPADGRRSSACRSAPTPAGSGCASTSSTWRCSITLRAAGRWRTGCWNTWTTCTNTSSILYE